MAAHNLISPVRNIYEVATRYPSLYISQDFAAIRATWPETYTEDAPFDTTVVTPFSFHPRPKMVEQAAVKKTVMTTKYSVRVALFSGAPAEPPAAAAGGGAGTAAHLLSQLHFVLLKRPKGGGLALIGGAWSPELDGDGSSTTPVPTAPTTAGGGGVDGGTTSSSNAALLKALSVTAARVVREQLGAELGGCKWTELLRIEYHRPAEEYKGLTFPEQRETVVVMMPDAWNHCPSLEEAVAAWQVREEERISALSKVLPDTDEFGRTIAVPEVEAYRQRQKLLLTEEGGEQKKEAGEESSKDAGSADDAAQSAGAAAAEKPEVEATAGGDDESEGKATIAEKTQAEASADQSTDANAAAEEQYNPEMAATTEDNSAPTEATAAAPAPPPAVAAQKVVTEVPSSISRELALPQSKPTAPRFFLSTLLVDKSVRNTGIDFGAIS